MTQRKRRAIAMPPEVDREVEAAARAAGVSYSAWMADVARKELILQAGLVAVGEYEREHGAFTPAELADAELAVGRLKHADAAPPVKSRRRRSA